MLCIFKFRFSLISKIKKKFIMESHPPAAFPWTSSPMDEYLASMEVCEAGVDEGRLKVEAFFAVGELVDPFRVNPPPAPLPPSWAATAWTLARSALFQCCNRPFLVERLSYSLLVASRRLEAGSLSGCALTYLPLDLLP